MKLIPQSYDDGEVYSYKADDEGNLYFSARRPFGGALDPPTSIEAAKAGHVCLVHPPTTRIPIEELRFVRIVRCGSRPSPNAFNTWTSNNTEAVYVWEHHGRREVVLHQFSGLGNRFLVIEQLGFDITFLPIVATLDEVVLWDILQALFGTYDEGLLTARNETTLLYQTAFLEGRLRRRRKDGTIKAVIVPRKE